MRGIVIFAVVAGGAGLLGCGNGSLTTPTQGSGGTFGGMGGGGAAGSAGAGGHLRGGAAGSAGAGGHFRGDGAAGDTGAVVPLDAGVCPSSAAPTLIPWRLLLPDAGAAPPAAGAAGTDGGTGGTSSGCTRTVNGTQTNIACAGDAWMRVDAGNPTIVWGDGAQMVWAGGGPEYVISPPAAAPGGQRVWASLNNDFRVLCPVCGAVSTIEIQVRESTGGKLLFLARSGYDGGDPTTDQLIALFGVDADSQTICTFRAQDGCVPVLLTLTQHVLRTTAAQVIPSGAPTTVSAPNGTFDVSWYSSFEKSTGQPQTCIDGVASGAMMRFVASRVSSAAP